MPRAARSLDHHSEAIVLRRVNYGEADRILDLITPSGIVSVIARAARKEKSKLAGGIELFCLSSVTYHEAKTGGLATLTSAKMSRFYQNILGDFAKMEFASKFLRAVARAARDLESPEFFQLTKSVLAGLDDDLSLSLIEIYARLNLFRIGGEEPNFHYDTDGNKLSPELHYLWDADVSALRPDSSGPIGANEIKLLRLMLTSPLELVARVKYDEYDKLRIEWYN